MNQSVYDSGTQSLNHSTMPPWKGISLVLSAESNDPPSYSSFTPIAFQIPHFLDPPCTSLTIPYLYHCGLLPPPPPTPNSFLKYVCFSRSIFGQLVKKLPSWEEGKIQTCMRYEPSLPSFTKNKKQIIRRIQSRNFTNSDFFVVVVVFCFSYLFYLFIYVGSSQTRAQTHVPCISRRILNHCATREAHQQ